MRFADADVVIGGFVDHHTHLLAAAAGTPFPWEGTTVRAFPRQLRREGTTPMDVPEPDSAVARPERPGLLYRGLAHAAAAGLVEVTEMGMRRWWYLDALADLGHEPLPARMRIYLASGLAERSGIAELGARRADCGPWIRLEGVKFYLDGWLVPRTCAMCGRFEDEDGAGIFQDSAGLARRMEPFASKGWQIATHAIGDRAVAAVLDAYEMVWGGDRRATRPPCPGLSTQRAARRASQPDRGPRGCAVHPAVLPADRCPAGSWRPRRSAGCDGLSLGPVGQLGGVAACRNGLPDRGDRAAGEPRALGQRAVGLSGLRD